MHNPSTSELRSFIARELDTLVPLLSLDDAAALKHDLANEALLTNAPQSFERALAVAQTKTWTLDLKRPGKHLLCSAYDFGQWVSISPLIQNAISDRRVGRVTFFGGGPAAANFDRQFAATFQDISTYGPSAISSFSYLCAEIGKGSDLPAIDVAVATVSTRFGPDSWILANAKSVLGASSLVLIYDVYGCVPECIPDQLEYIDAVLCSDRLTRECFLATERWNIDPDKVLVSGTGQTVTSELRQQRPAARQRALVQLGISGQEFVVTLLGDMTVEREWGSELPRDLALRSMREALVAIEQFARNNRAANFAVVLRPHPADPGSESLRALLSTINQSDNLTVRFTENSQISIDDLAACSDVICSLFSTETFKAPDRGITGIFLNARYFKQSALAILERAVADCPDLRVLDNASEISEVLEYLHANKRTACPTPNIGTPANSLLDAVLAYG